MLFLSIELLASNYGFAGIFATYYSGMRSWFLKLCIAALMCWLACPWCIRCLMYCRSVWCGTQASLETVFWLACSVSFSHFFVLFYFALFCFVLISCFFWLVCFFGGASCEVNEINLIDVSICENRNRLRNL